MKLFTAVITDPHVPHPRVFVGTTTDELFTTVEEFYEGQWEDDYATVREYVETFGLTLDQQTLAVPDLAPGDCSRHGGPWGGDETCEHCTDDDGEARDMRNPGPLGPALGSSDLVRPDLTKEAIGPDRLDALWAAFADLRDSFRLALAEHLSPETIAAVDRTVVDYIANYYGDD